VRPAVLILLVLVAAAAPLAAQRFVFGLAGVGGDYREATNDLRYDVSGLAGTALLTLGRFAAEATVSGLSYDPDESGTAAERFEAAQFDGYVRYRVVRWASLELGVTNREVREEFQFRAQSAAAFRVGVHSATALGPNGGVAARVNYLAGAKFSGGGSAPFAMDVGLSAYYAFARGRLRVTAESQFQHFSRTVDVGGTQDVPIQQVLGRLGLAVGF
jgi:hypothetical protein